MFFELFDIDLSALVYGLLSVIGILLSVAFVVLVLNIIIRRRNQKKSKVSDVSEEYHDESWFRG